MSAIPKEARFNYADLEQMPDDGRRYEVIDGDLVVSPSPFVRHQNAVTQLLLALARHVEAGSLGTVLPAPMDVKFSDEDVVEPDLLYLARERMPNLEAKFIDVPPDLVVEVLSEGSRTRDLGAKRKLYARFGVPHYWIVDLEADALTALRLAGDLYAVEATVPASGSFRPSLFPGLAIALAPVFAR